VLIINDLNKNPQSRDAMGVYKNNLEDGNLTKQYVKGKNADYSFNNKESAVIKFLPCINKDNKINLHFQRK